MELAMVDDRIVPIDEAMINAHDRGVYFGDGVYEVLRCCGGRLFELERHLARLQNSLREMDMLDKVDIGVIKSRIIQAVEQAEIADAIIYFHITRGSAVRTHNYDDNFKPGFFLTVRPGPSQSVDQPAAGAITHPDWRWKRCDIKSLNLLANVMAKHTAVKAGAYEAILVDQDGLITEATSSSVLIVRAGVLQTAPLSANILPGITRGLLLEWAGDVGLATLEKSFTVAEAFEADELILTGTGTEVMAVTQLDNQPVADSRPGPYTIQLQKKLKQAMIGGKA